MNNIEKFLSIDPHQYIREYTCKFIESYNVALWNYIRNTTTHEKLIYINNLIETDSFIPNELINNMVSYEQGYIEDIKYLLNKYYNKHKSLLFPMLNIIEFYDIKII